MLKKILYTVFCSSIPILILGYFLQTILIPVADYNDLSSSEVKRIQMDVAINYPLGTFLLYLGICSAIISGVLILMFYLNKYREKKLKRRFTNE